MNQSSLEMMPKCYCRICTYVNPNTRQQILCNYGLTLHCHLSKDVPRFSDGRCPPQGRIPWLPQGIKVTGIAVNPTTHCIDHRMNDLSQRSRRGVNLFDYLPRTRTLCSIYVTISKLKYAIITS
jgi:hypothetical protein